MPPSANGTCTISRVRPLSLSVWKLAADIGMSPAPKSLSATYEFVAPTNSCWPVLEPTARYEEVMGTLARASMRPSTSQKSLEGLVVPAPWSCCTVPQPAPPALVHTAAAPCTASSVKAHRRVMVDEARFFRVKLPRV